jgi:peptide/nickel transport system ATP-binding protein
MIKIKNFSVEFAGKIKVVDCLDLEVAAGLNTMVIGESGSGKSVMLSAILRLLPPAARLSGEILFAGMDLLRLPEKAMQRIRGRELAYIPQGSGNSLNPLLPVGFQVAEPIMEFKKMPRAEALAAAIALMEALNINEAARVARAYPHMISGGMKQRALIAMGAAGGAGTLLADEPTKGLDEENSARVIEVFQKLSGKTLLCVSHDLSFVKALADRVCVVYAAQQFEYCSKEDFFANPLHPYSKMLLDALPENGLQVKIGFAPPHDHYSSLGCHFSIHCPYAAKRCGQLPPLTERCGRKVRCWNYAH